MRKLYTDNEIVLCTYIARYGRGAFAERDIVRIENRSEDSIRMKVQNIAAMLDEENYAYSPEVPKLSGKPAGEKGRRTNWNVVKPLVNLTKEQLLEKCKVILDI